MYAVSRNDDGHDTRYIDENMVFAAIHLLDRSPWNFALSEAGFRIEAFMWDTDLMVAQ